MLSIVALWGLYLKCSAQNVINRAEGLSFLSSPNLVRVDYKLMMHRLFVAALLQFTLDNQYTHWCVFQWPVPTKC